MRFLSRLLLHSPLKSTAAATHLPSTFRLFSSAGGGGGDDFWNDATPSNWTMGLTKEHFDGEAVGRKIDTPEEPPSQPSQPQQTPPRPQQSPSQPRPKAGPTATTQFANAQWTEKEIDLMRDIETANKKGKAFVDGWGERLKEMSVLLKQVREPGARGSYLKDSEKAEMYKLHKENPEVYTVEKLAKDYRIMRQRVHAILWLKQDEEEMEKKLGYPLDDSVELLLDTCPE